jgi:hypothetical protein
MEAPALYPRLLGSVWDSLGSGVRDIHRGGSESRLSGTFEIQASTTKLGRLLCTLARLPTCSGTTRCDVLVEASATSERWSRLLGTWRFASTQLEEGGFLVERIGALDLRFRLGEERAGIRFTQVGACLRVFGLRVRIPRIFAPTVLAFELPGSDARAALIDITLKAPFVGMLVRYHGEVRRNPS